MSLSKGSGYILGSSGPESRLRSHLFIRDGPELDGNKEREVTMDLMIGSSLSISLGKKMYNSTRTMDHKYTW